MSRAFKEHDYIGLSEVSSNEQTSDKAKTSNLSEKTSKGLTLKATELRLGLPGSQSPERFVFEDDNGANCPIGAVKNLVSGAKRGFSDTINGGSGKWVLPKNGGSEVGALKNGVSLSSSVMVDDQKLQSSPVSGQGTAAAPASSKAQVVGWPPIRSFRKNTMAVNAQKINGDKDCKLESGCLYVKVSMDGAPYLRKVDLKNYGGYAELSSALEKMFSGFTVGQHDIQGVPGQDELSKGRLMDNLHHSEYVLTYEDKDDDWMLVGDVPWNMFMGSCRRLRIMKSSEAVGLASRATEK